MTKFLCPWCPGTARYEMLHNEVQSDTVMRFQRTYRNLIPFGRTGVHVDCNTILVGIESI